MLIALLSSGKGTWGHVSRLLSGYDKVHLLTNDFGKEKFTAEGDVTIHDVLEERDPAALKTAIANVLRPVLLEELEVDVNITSGSGTEHMAIIAALFELGVGFRLVYADDGVKPL